MLKISYTISPRLKEYLSRIENLRKQVLLTPISPSKELRLKWEATLDRIYSSLKLSGNPLSKQEVLKLLAETTRKKMDSNQEEVLNFKKALDYISQNWLGADIAVNAQALIGLHRIIGNGQLRVPQSGLQYLLDYLQTRSENPIIQAAIINIEMEKMWLFQKRNKLISYLAPLVFLYKYGYDFRGFLAYEKIWMEKDAEYKENHERALNSINFTLWLEYFAACMLKQIETIIQSLERPKIKLLDLRESFWQLNERQKSILGYLDRPQTTVINKQIQKKYKISQITASRDLAKLKNLGLLFSHGKGRSVYYTKI